MKARVDGNPVNDKTTSSLYQTAVGTAVVAGVFSLIVSTLLILNYIQRTVADARRIDELDALKIEILDQPTNEQLRSRIR